QATAAAPADPTAWLELGRVLLREGHDADAEPALARAVEVAPSSADARLQHGTALQRIGRADDARAELEKSTTLDSTSPEAWYALASLHRAAGRDAEQSQALAEF